MKIYLVGFMGCGKTTIGKRLASRLGFTFLDTDELFAIVHKSSVNDFFRLHTEKIFRREETNILHKTETMDNLVIATGGGMPCFGDNMQWILSNGIAIYIEMSPLALYSRLVNSKTERPLLSSSDNLKEDIANLFAQREPVYQKAHISVNGINFDMDDLMNRLSL
ncbi:MAG: shikimate kinase [Bacteroidales bacterium]|jgi:shikimate kinase|nr:shikimate kinase [Bacteroidales bacterium]